VKIFESIADNALATETFTTFYIAVRKGRCSLITFGGAISRDIFFFFFKSRLLNVFYALTHKKRNETKSTNAPYCI